MKEIGTDGQTQRLHREALLEAVLVDGSPLITALDMLVNGVAAALEVPVVLVSLVARDRQHFAGQVGMPPDAVTGTPISHSFCRHVTDSGDPLIVESAIAHPLVCDNPAIEDLGVVAYAGQPIVVDGQALGSLCAIHHLPHTWTESELNALRRFADLAEFLITARLQTQGILQDEQASAHARDQQQSATIADFASRVAEQERVAQFSRRFQASLLPAPDASEGIDVDLLAMSGDSPLLLGGDFADTALSEAGICHFVIGDVTGHGPESAAVAIALRSSWSALQAAGLGLSQIAEILDAQARREGLLTSALLGRLSPGGEVALLCAGHPFPICAGPEGARQIDLIPGPLLGFPEGSGWNVTTLHLGADELILFTDGLIEGRAAAGDGRFELDGVLRTLGRSGTDLNALFQAAVDANGGPLRDDVAIMRLRLRS